MYFDPRVAIKLSALLSLYPTLNIAHTFVVLCLKSATARFRLPLMSFLCYGRCKTSHMSIVDILEDAVVQVHDRQGTSGLSFWG
jgi:hypothetical protein